jgi:AraC family transcriptional regulator
MNSSSDIYRLRINQVIDHLDENLDRNVSLKELASVACFSPFHFHRIFVALMGESVNAFTSRLRNEKVARLLRFSQKPINEIALACGFSSTATLSRLFKQYFGATPSDYRKGGEIKNSKIRKDLMPVTDYHCKMERETLVTKFPVEIRQLPQRRIAYIRVTDAFREGVVIDAFARLIDWSKKAGLYNSETIFGMSKDDPEVTPKRKYRYEVCITMPMDFKIDADSGIQSVILPACRYAFTKVSGDMNVVGAGINYLFDTWLISSGYECEAQPGLEVFLDKEKVCDWHHFDLELGIPVKKIMRSGSKK